MLGNRSIGLRTLSLAGLLLLVTLSFWGWVLVWESPVWEDRDALQRSLLPLARAIGAAVSIGAAVDRNEDRWLDVRSASCFLVHGRKP